jgi:hypothetical protein
MLARVGESHSHGTRVPRSELAVTTGDRRLVGVQDPDGVGDPDRGAEGNRVGGGLQAELEG